MSVYDDVAREAAEDYRDWLRDEYEPEVTALDFAEEDFLAEVARRNGIDQPAAATSGWGAPPETGEDFPVPF